MMLGIKGLNGWANGLASRHKSDTTLVVSLKSPGQIVGTRGIRNGKGNVGVQKLSLPTPVSTPPAPHPNICPCASEDALVAKPRKTILRRTCVAGYPGVLFSLTRPGAKFRDVTEWHTAGASFGDVTTFRTKSSRVRVRRTPGY